MKLRSMTGFARVRETISDIEVVLSIKSVNHRGLDIHFYTGAELDPFESAIRSAVKKSVSRGHLDIRTQLSRAGSSGSTLGVDNARLDGWIAAFREASSKYRLTGEPDLNAAFRSPGILSDNAALELPESFEGPLVSLLERGLQQLNSFREREGSEIGALLVERADSLS